MQEFIVDSIKFLQELLAGFINKIIVAIILVLIGFIIGKAVSKLLQKTLKQVELNKVIKDISGIRISLEGMIYHFVEYFIYFISIVMALRHIGIATDILNILSAVVIVLIGIFILLSIKDFIPNVISGIILHQKATIKKGDIIIINNVKGKVESMTLLETRLKTKSGDIIIIPNSNLTKNEITKKRNFN